MVILAGAIEIKILVPSGLKNRRKIINSIRQKLKNMGLSAIDSSGDRADEGLIEFVMALHSENDAKEWAQRIEKFLNGNAFEYEFDLEWGVL